MRGDSVEVVIDTGESSRTYTITATRAGRRVEVTEVTRGGTPVRTARFMSGRVIAVVEHPAADAAQPDDSSVTPLHRPA